MTIHGEDDLEMPFELPPKARYRAETGETTYDVKMKEIQRELGVYPMIIIPSFFEKQGCFLEMIPTRVDVDSLMLRTQAIGGRMGGKSNTFAGRI